MLGILRMRDENYQHRRRRPDFLREACLEGQADHAMGQRSAAVSDRRSRDLPLAFTFGRLI